jgi:arsenate reductase
VDAQPAIADNTALTGQEEPMSRTVIYHNPRCSKSRQTLELLNQHGVDADVVEYLKAPPDATRLKDILAMLGLRPRDLIRTGENEYKELGLNDPSLSDAQLIAAMVEHPRLIQRPIVVRDDRAALGRPPEQVLEIL